MEKDPNEKKIKYPKSVFFIIATELSERFSYYGMRAVLTIYMRNMLNFNEDKATTFYHTFLLMCYGIPFSVPTFQINGTIRNLKYLKKYFSGLPIVWGIIAGLCFSSFAPFHISSS